MHAPAPEIRYRFTRYIHPAIDSTIYYSSTAMVGGQSTKEIRALGPLQIELRAREICPDEPAS
jgi:hypothetical protein